METEQNGRPLGQENAPIDQNLEPDSIADSIPPRDVAGQPEMGFTSGFGVNRPVGSWIVVRAWNPWSLKKHLETLKGNEAWWAPVHFDGAPRRGQFEAQIQNLPGDAAPKVRQRLEKELKRAVMNYRCTENFVAGYVLVADLDYHDADGRHVATPADFRIRIKEVMREGGLPGNLGHLTPRGARVAALLPATVTDPEAFCEALRGFLKALQDVLNELGLLDDGDGGFRVDDACAEVARAFFAPNAGDRSAEVVVWSDELPPADVWAQLAPSPSPRVTHDDPEVDVDGLKNQREKLLALAENCEFFKDRLGHAYARLPGDMRAACFAIESPGFEDWLRCEALERLKMTTGTTVLREVTATLAAGARKHGDAQDVFLRVGSRNGRIYIDLGGDGWRVVEIDREGWRVLDKSPVLFRRAPGMLALPEPKQGGTLDLLRPFVNGNEDAFNAVVAYLLVSLHSEVQYPVMLVHGEEGSAKSTLLRIIQRLVDPNEGDLLSPPDSIRDFSIMADNSWLLPVDNVSKLSIELSDAICRLSTGGGYRTRSLYTNRNLEVFKARRPVVLNGISQFAFKGDILHRSLYLELEHIPDNQRRPERLFWKEFLAVRPLILGALCTALSAGLRCVDQITMDTSARLGDAAEFLTAVESGMGWPVGRFNELLQTSGDRGIHEALEACSVSSEVLRLFREQGEWSGRPGMLLSILRDRVSEHEKKLLPKRPNSLTKKLKRNARVLRRMGCEVVAGERGTDGGRVIRLRKPRHRS